MTSARWATGVALLAVIAVCRPAHPGQPSPRAGELVDAFLRTDFDGIARAGQREAARGLAPLLAGTDLVTVRAAIDAAPFAEDGWQLLTDLARLARSPDRQLGPPAARAAATISQALTPLRIEKLEIPAGALRERAGAWRKIALRAGAWPDVRVHAVEINRLLVQTLPKDARSGIELDLVAIADDPEPEVRRAALELLPQPLDELGRQASAGILRDDSDPVVAIVAGQVLCGGLAVGDDPKPILDEAADSGLERIRNLVVNKRLPVVARLDAAECLRAAGGTDNRKALQTMAARMPRHARARARKLARATSK